jgi:hypothetical protein
MIRAGGLEQEGTRCSISVACVLRLGREQGTLMLQKTVPPLPLE